MRTLIFATSVAALLTLAGCGPLKDPQGPEHATRLKEDVRRCASDRNSCIGAVIVLTDGRTGLIGEDLYRETVDLHNDKSGRKDGWLSAHDIIFRDDPGFSEAHERARAADAERAG